ncbi:hypothetical protein ACI6Q2_15880 [Chitinophagaceae bacterium LWZ2-11]
MKKIFLIINALYLPFIVQAADNVSDKEFELYGRVIGNGFLVVLIFLVSAFILNLVKTIQGNRLKKGMLEKGVPDQIIEKFLQPDADDRKGQAIKTFLILAGIGLGLIGVHLTLPLGVHSAAILALSIACSFLGYYFYIKKTDR